MQVFQILYSNPHGRPVDFRDTALYRACVAAGIIPLDQEDLDKREARAQASEAPQPLKSFEAELSQELTLNVQGMWCAACAYLIEDVLRKVEGVVEVQAFFLSDLARIKYLPHRVRPQTLLDQISKLGYTASLFHDETEGTEKKALLLRLGISSILTMNIMMISFSLYFGFFQDLGEQAIHYLSYPLWILATPVLFYGGLPILKKAYTGLRHRSASMDTLIASGSLSAYLYSLVGLARGSLHLYFDTSAMLITLVLLGRYIELRARDRVAGGMTELYRLARQKARLATKGPERWVVSEAVKAGDECLVKKNERIPVDGRIISGRAVLDESFLTGESRPVKRSAGDRVMAGGLVLEGEAVISAVSAGPESSLAQMVNLMQEALSRKNPVELIADRITKRLVPAVMLLATATFLYLFFGGTPTDAAMLRAVTVLVITCPCALGIATPLAKVAALAQGRRKGLLIGDPAVLEKARDLDAMVLDKTGTVTQGRFSLSEICALEGSEEEVLRTAASVEAYSEHFLAREILRKASELHPAWEKASQAETVEGLGVKGVLNGRSVFVGSRQFMEGQGMKLPPELDEKRKVMESEGMTAVYLAREASVAALFSFGDRVREGSFEAVSGLHSRGLATFLVSGDSQDTTRAIAQELGIRNFTGQNLPQDKAEFIQELQKQGHLVGMAGDGINDAAALARADVGFALGANSSLLQQASHVTILSSDPRKILEFIDLSGRTMKIIHQNLFFSFFYNVMGIPLAVSGVLNPILAVLAMFASSLTVIGNTLRISR
jgi:Cu2+-exporting ATPase/Cu+-exporting ATPase